MRRRTPSESRRPPGSGSPRTLREIRRDLRWQRLCPALQAAGSVFGHVGPPFRPADLSAQWAEHLDHVSAAAAHRRSGDRERT